MVDTEYWDQTAGSKTFTHPLDIGLLAKHVPRSGRILDYGCGYGRLTGELRAAGFERAQGCDASGAMIQRAQSALGPLGFSVVEGLPLPFEDNAFDAVVLFSVLTCIPADRDQRELVADLVRLLRPPGLLYISDLALQDDSRNVARYKRYESGTEPYGIFETDDGARFRHMSADWLDELFGGLEEVHARSLDVRTMNGNPARAFQRLLRVR